MFKQLADGNLVEITRTSACACGIWRRVKARKSTWCILSRRFIKSGDMVWRPHVERNKTKGQRIADAAMQMYLAADKGKVK
jgi:hypothetical protein